MEYTNKNSLKRCLTEITKNWEQKLFCLYQIIRGLDNIHGEDLIHYNFHDGNILCNKYKENIYGIFISDYLGLYQLTKSFLKENDIYGILPFIAPEILRGQPYTQASDIYSFSIIMWEFTSEISPFNDKAHDLQLALSICKGKRPEIIENTPQCYIDLMKKCWDEDPLKRPSSEEVLNIIGDWIFLPWNKEIEDINEELKNNIMEFINAPIEHNNLIVESHPKACYTSHLLDFTSKELNEILEGSQGFLVNLQQNSTLQNEEFAKKESTLQIQITNLQSEKQALVDKLSEQLKQNSQLNQEKNNLQNELVQTETIIQELKSQQDQFKNQLNQFQIGYKQIEEENLKLEKIAETYYQSSQNELVNLQQRNSQTEKVILKLENELFDLQQRNLKFEQNNQNLKQRNFEFEQNNQSLRLNLAKQIKKFAEKENILQTEIIDLQNEKQNLAGILINLTEQLEQNKLTNQKVQDQISQLKQDEIKLQEKLAQTEANIQELKSHKESLIEQKEQLEVNYEQIKQEKIRLQNMVSDLLQDQKFTTELKAKLAKLEKEIAQLEQKLIIEEKIKIQLTQALQIKEDRINELEQGLINLDQERIKKLQDKRKELSEIEKELLNKLTIGKNTKEIHKEKDAKQKEMNELQQELSRTSASYDANRKKLIFNQVNNFLKVKGGFLTLREEAIKKLQNCCNNLESSINKKRNTIGSIRDMKTSKLTDKYTKEFQKIVQENKELEVSLITENILKLNSFDLDKYKIFKFATNSQEGTRIQLNTNMMSEDINSLRKNLNELKLELNQEKKELKNLATV
ncbi:unnamed protein product [Rhizophagus irregularis]|nr:unnamed protein product [Rhizophagus irregularis]